MSSPQRLSELVDLVTRENAEINVAPPAVASENPLTELLIHEVQTGVPNEIRSRLSSDGDSRNILDWIGIAAVLKGFAASDQKRVLDELGDDPKRLPIALVVAWPYEPVTPSKEQRRLDYTGLALQLGFATLLLTIRSLVVLRFVQVTILRHPWELLAGVLYLPLLASPTQPPPRISWPLVAALLMLLLDFMIAPNIMERLRQLPATIAGKKGVWQPRPDSLQFAWKVQAIIFGIIFFWKLTIWVI